MMKIKKDKIILYICVALVVLWAGFPLYWMFITSIRPDREIVTWPPSIITLNPTLKHVYNALFHIQFFAFLRNSLVATLSSIALVLFVASLGGYSLARFNFPGKSIFANSILMTYMFPPVVLAIPFHIIFRFLGLNDSLLGLTITYTSISLPFSLWLLWAYFQTVPIQIEESALIDGASRLRTLFSIVFPTALPGIIATSIFTFVTAYNDYLFARIIISSESLKTLPLGIMDVYEAVVTDWGLLMALSLVSVLPALAFFVAIQRFLIRGWGMGAVKG